MNLTDYRRTSIPKVVEFIRAEIAGTGVEIAGTELGGSYPWKPWRMWFANT